MTISLQFRHSLLPLMLSLLLLLLLLLLTVMSESVGAKDVSSLQVRLMFKQVNSMIS